MNALLNACAQQAAGPANQISYPVVAGAAGGVLARLWQGIGTSMTEILRRQAALRALDDGGRGPAALALWPAGGRFFLASQATPIRSSHSGTPIDPNLPRGPYTPAAPPAGLAGAGIRLRASYEWLSESTTEHTTHPPGLPADPNRVASYFEVTLQRIRFTPARGPELILDGGRVCYDPFGHRAFISEHYAAQYEITNLPALNTPPIYAAVIAEINNFAAAHAPAPVWANYLTQTFEANLGVDR
jgi:hypothetical protein